MQELTLITSAIHGPNIEIIIVTRKDHIMGETFTFLPYKINLAATYKKHCTTVLRTILCCNRERNVILTDAIRRTWF